MSEKLDNVDDKWFRAEISKKDLKELSKKSDLERLANLGVSSFLVGESLMRQQDVEKATRSIMD